MPRWMNKYLLDPATDAAAGGATPDASKAAEAAKAGAGGSPTPPAGGNAQGVNDAKVQEQLKTLQTQLEAAKQEAEAVKLLFTPGADPAKVEKTARTFFASMGFNKEQIDEWVAGQVGATPQNPQGGNGGQQRPNEFESRLNETNRLAVDARKSQLDGHLTKSVERLLDTDQGLSTLNKAAQTLRGPKEASNVSKSLKEALQAETVSRIRARYQRTGETLNESLITEEANAAAKEVYGRFSAVIGDPSSLGRSSETSINEQAILNRTPVPVPKYSSKKDAGTVEKELTDWLIDGMVRDAAEVGGTQSRI